MKGVNALNKAELIAILLRTGLKGTNVVEVGRRLLKKYDGSLRTLATLTVDDLRQIKGIGRDKAVTLLAAFELAKRMAEELQDESPVLDNPANVVALLRAKNLVKNVETLQVLLLNTRRRLIRVEPVTDGTIDTLPVLRARFSRPPSRPAPPPWCWRTIIRAATRRRARRTSR